MAGEKPSVSDRQFRDEIARKTEVANKTFEKDLRKKIDSSVRNSSDTGTLVEENMKRIFKEKSADMQKQILDLRGRQDVELQALEDYDFLARYELAIGKLQERFNLAMEISGGQSGKIETDEELAHFAQTGLHMLEAMHTEWLFDFNVALPASLSEQIEQDFFGVIDRLRKNPDTLSPEDAEMLAGKVRKLSGEISKENPPQGEDSLAVFILAYLTPGQRMSLLKHMMPEKGTYDLVVDLVKMDYISSAQGETLFQEEIVRLEAVSEGVRRKERKEIEAQTEVIEQSIVDINSKETKKTRKRVRREKKRAVRSMKRSFGHKNRAKDLFSLKGIASALLIANGSMTVAANTLANLHDPFAIAANPYLWLGVGMTAGGLELSNGFDGMAPTGERALAWLAKDKDAIDEEKVAKREERMRKDLTDPGHRMYAELYYNNIEEIIQTYNEKKRTNPDDEVKITLKSLAINPESQETKDLYPGLNPVEAEDLLTTWAKYFFETKDGVKKTVVEQQKTFFEEAFKEEGLEINNSNVEA